METSTKKFTKLQNEMFSLMCKKAGKKLSQREIANNLGVSPTAVAKSLILLDKEGLVKKIKDTRINLIRVEFNRENRKAVYRKRVENIKLIYESDFIDSLEEKFPGSTIILFGSYSRGEDLASSDVDLAVIGCSEKKIILKKYEKFLEREIRINFFKNLKKIEKEFKESLCNGIVFSGGIEL